VRSRTWPGVRPGGPPKAEPGALTPGQRRRRRRLDPDTVSSLMSDLIKSHNEAQGQAGELLPHARLHDLRHVHAITLLLAGVPVHVVAARLGHADPSITLRVYAHVIREHVAAAADIFARSIPPAGRAAVSKSVSKKAPPAAGKVPDLARSEGLEPPTF
jgi:integrase